MASKKLGTLIKDARTKAGFTQEALAKKVGGGLTASQISKAERGEGDLTQEQLKKIAKLCGVTQASLLDAAKSSTRTTTAKTTATKTTSTKTTAAKTPANANSSMKVTTNERSLVEAYRAATSEQKRAALKVLKGQADSLVDNILGTAGVAGQIGEAVEGFLGNLIGGK